MVLESWARRHLMRQLTETSAQREERSWERDWLCRVFCRCTKVVRLATPTSAHWAQVHIAAETQKESIPTYIHSQVEFCAPATFTSDLAYPNRRNFGQHYSPTQVSGKNGSRNRGFDVALGRQASYLQPGHSRDASGQVTWAGNFGGR
jgi:hypothetical protein